jgi:cytoskeletal protein CcmA (bactofilin family)
MKLQTFAVIFMLLGGAGRAQAESVDQPHHDAAATSGTPEARPATTPDSPKVTVDSDDDGHEDDVRVGQGVVVTAGERSDKNIVVYGHPVSIEGTHHGDITVFGSTVRVSGSQTGNIVLFGGALEVSGKVEGSISVVGGGIHLARTANVSGDVSVVGGSLDRDPGAVLHGNVSVATPHLPRHAIPFGLLGGLGLGFSFLSWLSWHLLALVVGILVLAIVPARVEAAGSLLRERWLASLGYGFLAGVVVFPLTLVFALTCVGVVIPPAFYQIAKYFGITVLFVVVGEALGRSLLKRELSALGSFLLGFGILSLLALVAPGGSAWLVYGWFGVGCALLTRFGTMRPWFKGRVVAAAAAPTMPTPAAMPSETKTSATGNDE